MPQWSVGMSAPRARWEAWQGPASLAERRLSQELLRAARLLALGGALLAALVWGEASPLEAFLGGEQQLGCSGLSPSCVSSKPRGFPFRNVCLQS